VPATDTIRTRPPETPRERFAQVNTKRPPGSKGRFSLAVVLALWIITAWLLYPLIAADTVDMSNVKEYIYRSALGITIMIILFGKTLVDLIFPLVSSEKMPLVNTLLLTVYSLALAGGIVFMIVRLVFLYMKSRKGGLLF
jgi:uncharacterized membrane protein YhdT